MSFMKDIQSHQLPSLNARDFGRAFRAERKAQGKSQAAIAAMIGARRQTIVALEAGRNVGLYTVFAALAALGKGLLILDARPEMDRLEEYFGDDEDERP
jgi:transcriptional regulator with XRE-family HTH domain